MCDMCPTDWSDIREWREHLKALEQRIYYSYNEAKRYEAELKSARKDLKQRLRKGQIRNT